MLLTCVACTAVWERHGAWTGRIREPDREQLLDGSAPRAGDCAGGTVADAGRLPRLTKTRRTHTVRVSGTHRLESGPRWEKML